MEFIFEKSPLEQLLELIDSGDKISALELLNQIQDLSDEEAEEILLGLEEHHIVVDVSDIPQYWNDEKILRRLQLEQKLAKNRQLMTGLDENDPLRLFLEEMISVQATGDEKLLAEQYAAGDESVAEQLAAHVLPRVVEHACAMAGRGLVLLDLIQEGFLGFWMGIRNYTGGDYEEQACRWIDRYLIKAILMQAKSGEVIYKMREGMSDYIDADQRLLVELGRNPTVEEIADSLHITAEEAATYASMLTQAKARQKVDQTIQPEETSEEEDQSADNTAYFQMRQRIAEMLSTLSPREAEVLSLRFGLEGGLPQTPEQTGVALGLTPDEVIKIEASALSKLRQQAD